MKFKEFCKKYAIDINGEYREYDEHRSIIIIPLADGRVQTVTGHLTENTNYNRQVVQLKTKVCSLSEKIPFEDILTQSAAYPYTKFIIEDGFLMVEAISFMDNLNEDMVREMFQEIAHHADDWEFKITGKDIH